MPDPDRIVVSNTTPIIALSLIDKLSLLGELYGRVLIPSAVASEFRAGVDRSGVN